MNEARQLLALAIPVIIAQVAQTAMGFVDTVMAGGYSATDMAAVAIGTSIWLPAILFRPRPVAGADASYRSAEWLRRRERIAHQVRQGFWLAGVVSVLIMVVLWNAGHIIRPCIILTRPSRIKPWAICAHCSGARRYLFFQVARNQCEGLAKPNRAW
jgi:MATE family multidrug resistance protein